MPNCVPRLLTIFKDNLNNTFRDFVESKENRLSTIYYNIMCKNIKGGKIVRPLQAQRFGVKNLEKKKIKDFDIIHLKLPTN